MSAKRILLVDNDQDVRDVIFRMLKKIGFKTISVTNGCDAVSTFSERVFDGVIAEYHLADMTGLALAKTLRGLRPGIPILLLTAFLDQSIRELIEAEGVPVMMKPVLRHELRDALRSLLHFG